MTKGFLNDDFDVPGDITAGGIENTPIGSTTTANGYFTEIGAGTVAVPHGAVGSGIVAVEGANAAVGGPHMQFTTASDDYPLMQILPWTHDNVNIYFDGYRDSGGQKSSSSNGNFRIKKGSDVLEIAAETGISAGSAATFANVWEMTADGERTLPLQPWFFGEQGAASNITGDGTAYSIAPATVKDVGGNESSGTYTSPVTGSYLTSMMCYYEGILAAHTYGRIQANTSNGNYGQYNTISDHATAFNGHSWAQNVDMDAADTQTWSLAVFGSTKVIDLNEAWISVTLIT